MLRVLLTKDRGVSFFVSDSDHEGISFDQDHVTLDCVDPDRWEGGFAVKNELTQRQVTALLTVIEEMLNESS